jgi:hypothetical protein
MMEWQAYVRTSQDSLRTIAELTGGYAAGNQNDFDKALKRIDAETSDYYMLGYYSSNPDPLRRTRQIEVKTGRRQGVIPPVRVGTAGLALFLDVGDLAVGREFPIPSNDAPARQGGEAKQSHETHSALLMWADLQVSCLLVSGEAE